MFFAFWFILSFLLIRSMQQQEQHAHNFLHADSIISRKEETYGSDSYCFYSRFSVTKRFYANIACSCPYLKNVTRNIPR